MHISISFILVFWAIFRKEENLWSDLVATPLVFIHTISFRGNEERELEQIFYFIVFRSGEKPEFDSSILDVYYLLNNFKL